MLRRRRAATTVLVLLATLMTSPAAAQDPPLEEARVEGTFENPLGFEVSLLRFSAVCSEGPCDLTGEARVVDLQGMDMGDVKSVPVEASFDGETYTARAEYSIRCEVMATAPGGGFETLKKRTGPMRTVWTATFEVTEAGYIDGDWRATELEGTQRVKQDRRWFDPSDPAGGCEGESNEGSLVAVGTEAASSEPPPDAGDDAGPVGNDTDASAAARARAAEAREKPLFARTVQDPADASTALEDIVRSLLLVMLLIVLIVFPSQLFNSTLEANYDEIRGWFSRKRPAASQRLAETLPGPAVDEPPPPGPEAHVEPEAAADPQEVSPVRRRLRGWAAFLAFTLVASILYGFLDPAFGWNRGSLMQLVILVISTIVLTLVFAFPIRAYMKRAQGDGGYLKVLPGALVFAVLCVVASRLAHFQPGYFYGVIAGFAFTRSLARDEAGRATALGGVAMLTLALVAWALRAFVPGETDAFVQLLFAAILGGLFVGGVEGLVFGLLPLRFMSGEKLWTWSKPLWLVLIGIGLFVFVHVLMDPEAGYLADTNYTPLGTVIGLFAGFGIFSVSFWAYFRYRKKPALAT